jgi:acyl transferase domain-containing protein
MGPVRGRPLTDWLFAHDSQVPGIADLLRSTDIAQPVLFALEYALAQALLASGVRPTAMVGHSIGEYVAACLSGVMSLPDAAHVVVERGRLMASMPPGAMLAVRGAAADVATRLPADVTVAAINGPRLCVVSGPEAGITAAEHTFRASDMESVRLQTSHAFHSASMDGAARALEQVMRTVTLHPPTIPFASCVTGGLITAAEATDPVYWGRQLRAPVRFADGLRAAAGEGPVLVVEAGPRETLGALARQILAGMVTAVASLPLREGAEDPEGYVAALGAAWCAGAGSLHVEGADAHPVGVPVSLPGYPFDRRRCWIDAAGEGDRRSAVGAPAASELDVLIQTQADLIARQRDLLRRSMPSSRDPGGVSHA